jgi:short-subunit dehydrogenase
LRDDAKIEILINNAGAGLGGSFIDQSAEAVRGNVALNTTAVVRLAHAIAPRLVATGTGSIINLGSVVGLAPEFGMSVYGATKAFVLFLSQGLALELGPKGVYVQAVLPAATRTELWGRAGADEASLPPMMDVGEMVDAALAGYDAREGVTIPPLHHGELWDAFQTARRAMLPGFGEIDPAPRYSRGDTDLPVAAATQEYVA